MRGLWRQEWQLQVASSSVVSFNRTFRFVKHRSASRKILMSYVILFHSQPSLADITHRSRPFWAPHLRTRLGFALTIVYAANFDVSTLAHKLLVNIFLPVLSCLLLEAWPIVLSDYPRRILMGGLLRNRRVEFSNQSNEKRLYSILIRLAKSLTCSPKANPCISEQSHKAHWETILAFTYS